MSSKRYIDNQAVWLTCLIVLAASLRVFKLGDWSFWIEEHHTIRHTAAMTSLENILNSTRPLFYLLQKPVFDIFGESEFNARIVAALIGISTIPIFYYLTKKIFDSRIGYLAALLLTISPWHIYWSQNARFYSLLLLLNTLSLVSFYIGIETDDLKYILFSIITLGLAGTSHSIAALSIPVFFIYFFLIKWLPFAKPPGLRYRNLAPFIFLPLFGYGVYEIYRVFLANDISLAALMYTQFINSSTASFVGYGNPLIMITSTLYRIGTPLAYLSIIGAYYLIRVKSRRGLFLALSAYIPLSILTLLTSIASTTSRYAFMALPFWIMLAAVGIQEIYKRGQKNKFTLLWLLGFPIIFFRDPAVKDIIYYVSRDQFFTILLSLGLLAGLVGVLCFARQKEFRKYRLASTNTAIILLLLVAHPLIADSMYFAFQGGYRDRWNDAVAFVRQEKGETEMVVASIPPIVTYYLGEEAVSFRTVDLSTVLTNEPRIWIIEEYGMQETTGASFEQWAKMNCVVAGNWDQFAGGRLWVMRVHRCELTKPEPH